MRFVSLIIAASIVWGAPAAWAKPTAFLVMSGKNPSKHLCDMFTTYEKGLQSFSSWNRVALVDNGPNATDPNMPVCDAHGFEQFDSQGRPLYEYRMPKGPPPVTGAARFEVLTQQLREKIKNTRPGDPVLIYFAAHGSRNGDRTSNAELWGHSVSVTRMRELLTFIPKDRKVILVHDQCWGAGMLEELWEANGNLRPNTCAFAAARADEQGWTRQFILDSVNTLIQKKREGTREAQNTPVTFADAYQYATEKGNIHSTPVSSSGYFLDRYLKNRLGAKRLNDKAVSSVCATCTGTLSELKPSTIPALASQVVLLKDEVTVFARNAGIKGPVTAAALEVKSEELGAKFDAVYKEQVRLESLLAKAKTEFAKSKIGGTRFRHYSEQRKRMERLEAELLKHPHPERQKELESLKQNISVLDREISEFRNGAVKKSPEFQNFLAAHSKTYPHGIYDLIEKKASEKTEILSQIPTVRKALLAATQLTALEVISKTNDQDALNKYLSLLSCEATLIEDKPSMLKRFFQ